MISLKFSAGIRAVKKGEETHAGVCACVCTHTHTHNPEYSAATALSASLEKLMSSKWPRSLPLLACVSRILGM